MEVIFLLSQLKQKVPSDRREYKKRIFKNTRRCSHRTSKNKKKILRELHVGNLTVRL
jgi:hypothetical protein